LQSGILIAIRTAIGYVITDCVHGISPGSHSGQTVRRHSAPPREQFVIFLTKYSKVYEAARRHRRRCSNLQSHEARGPKEIRGSKLHEGSMFHYPSLAPSLVVCRETIIYAGLTYRELICRELIFLFRFLSLALNCRNGPPRNHASFRLTSRVLATFDTATSQVSGERRNESLCCSMIP